MLAKPKGIESQLLRPISYRQNFFIVLLVGTAELRMAHRAAKTRMIEFGRLCAQTRLDAGYGIHWSDLDEDLITEGLLRGAPAPHAR